MKFLLSVLLFALIPYQSLACTVRVFSSSGELMDIVVLDEVLPGRHVGKYSYFHFLGRFKASEDDTVAFTVSWGQNRLCDIRPVREGWAKVFLTFEPYVFHLSCEKN